MRVSINRALVALVLAGSASLAFTGGSAAVAAGDTVDEIHYAYGETAGQVYLQWHGAESTVYFGPSDSYGSTAAATTNTVVPVDLAGPFRTAKLTGLDADTVYHYRIGPTGLDHTLTAAPSGSFTAVDIGDTGSTLCNPWMADMQALVAAQSPVFVTHGGDISYANECGQAAVHRYFQDQMLWSTGAAFQPQWGNHEYGPPNSESVPGAPKDTLANYKGRVQLTNAQTLPASDTASKRSQPGCDGPLAGNNCRGDDWGWFRAGHVLYIGYPDSGFYNSFADWKPVVTSLMAAAQADPTIDFIVTYGHRPAWSSDADQVNTDLRAVLTTLSAQYSPTAAHPDGKYVLSIGHHVHGEEVFSPIGGLTVINNGGGGAGITSLSPPAANSILRYRHLGLMREDYDAAAHTLTVNVLCGALYTPSPKDPCTYGTSLYAKTFTAAGTTPPPPKPVVTVAHSDGAASLPSGATSTYTATVHVTTADAAGVGLAVTVPAGATLTAQDAGATVNGSTVTWSLGPVAAGATVTRSITVTEATSGTSAASTATVTTADGACANPGSACAATDTDTLTGTGGGPHEWVTNPSVETNLTGWTGLWGGAPTVTVSRDDDAAHTGSWSVQVSAGAGSSNLSTGYSDGQTTVTSAVAGTTYHGTVWVKAQATGQKITLRLREWSGSTLVTDVKVQWTATGTAWHQIAADLPAARSGTKLAVAVYADGMNAGSSFRGDDMSLTSP